MSLGGNVRPLRGRNGAPEKRVFSDMPFRPPAPRARALRGSGAARLILVLVTWFLLNAYAGRPLRLAMGPFSGGTLLSWLAIALVGTLPLIAFFASRAESLPLRRPLVVSGYLALGDLVDAAGRGGGE